MKEYKANVSENYLEIHLFWAGKGSFTVPVLGTFGPLISAVSAKPGITISVEFFFSVSSLVPKFLHIVVFSDFTPTVGNRPPTKEKHKTGLVVGAIVGLGLLGIFAGAGMFIIRKSRKRYTDDEGNIIYNNTNKPLSLNAIFQVGSYFRYCRAA